VPASGGVATPAAAPAQGRQRPPVSQQRPQAPRAEQQKQQQQQRAPRPPREGQAPRNDQASREERESRESRDAARAAREAEKAFRNPLPPITYPEDLPVSGRREEIAKALMENQVIIVSGETGSGKTTQLPKICLELGRGQKGMIGHTQPRRIAASSTAKRIAQELGTPLGETVGFKVLDTLSRGASVKLMTDGILLAETQTDPLLKNYDTIIIDEAHERSLNIDFLLGYLKQLLPRRPDLKIIITSATIDAERFSRHFGTPEKPAPVIEVSGRLYQVEVRYRPVEREPASARRMYV
jgi:ATP-dependent helicase HrpA